MQDQDKQRMEEALRAIREIALEGQAANDATAWSDIEKLCNEALDGVLSISVTMNASEAAHAIRTPKEGFLTEIKEGSQVAVWSPHGFPEAIIIAHPEDPPRLVYFDGTEEELSMKDGSIVLPPVVGHSADFSISVGVGEPRCKNCEKDSK